MLIRVKNLDPRRKQELLDSRFIYEDNKAIANLPETPINTIWQQNKVYQYEYIDDGVRPLGRILPLKELV